MVIGGGYARLVSASVCRISGLINIGTFVACTGPTPPPLRLPHCKRPAAAAAAAAGDDFSVENGLRGTSGASLGEARYLARHALISAKPVAGQFDGTYGTVMDQQAVLTDSTADLWPRVPLQQPADRSRAPLHRLTPGFRMRGAERNNDMISVANATQGSVVV